MRIVDNAIKVEGLINLARQGFGNMVKAVVDVERGIMAVDGELHADEEALLIENGSEQSDLWGINIYPELSGEERVEFDSMINLKPAHGNRTRGIDSPDIKKQVVDIVERLIAK